MGGLGLPRRGYLPLAAHNYSCAVPRVPVLRVNKPCPLGLARGRCCPLVLLHPLVSLVSFLSFSLFNEIDFFDFNNSI